MRSALPIHQNGVAIPSVSRCWSAGTDGMSNSRSAKTCIAGDGVTRDSRVSPSQSSPSSLLVARSAGFPQFSSSLSQSPGADRWRGRETCCWLIHPVAILPPSPHITALREPRLIPRNRLSTALSHSTPSGITAWTARCMSRLHTVSMVLWLPHRLARPAPAGSA